ncbi:hypothetical protein ACE6H2_003118 [Prunus campanulata]
MTASSTYSAAPFLPYGAAVQNSVDSGIAIDLNMAAVVEKGPIIQGTTQETVVEALGVRGEGKKRSLAEWINGCVLIIDWHQRVLGLVAWDLEGS